MREEAERKLQAKDMELEYVMQLAQTHQETIVQEVTALIHTHMREYMHAQNHQETIVQEAINTLTQYNMCIYIQRSIIHT